MSYIRTNAPQTHSASVKPAPQTTPPTPFPTHPSPAPLQTHTPPHAPPPHPIRPTDVLIAAPNRTPASVPAPNTPSRHKSSLTALRSPRTPSPISTRSLPLYPQDHDAVDFHKHSKHIPYRNTPPSTKLLTSIRRLFSAIIPASVPCHHPDDTFAIPYHSIVDHPTTQNRSPHVTLSPDMEPYHHQQYTSLPHSFDNHSTHPVVEQELQSFVPSSDPPIIHPQPTALSSYHSSKDASTPFSNPLSSTRSPKDHVLQRSPHIPYSPSDISVVASSSNKPPIAPIPTTTGQGEAMFPPHDSTFTIHPQPSVFTQPTTSTTSTALNTTASSSIHTPKIFSSKPATQGTPGIIKVVPSSRGPTTSFPLAQRQRSFQVSRPTPSRRQQSFINHDPSPGAVSPVHHTDSTAKSTHLIANVGPRAYVHSISPLSDSNMSSTSSSYISLSSPPPTSPQSPLPPLPPQSSRGPISSAPKFRVTFSTNGGKSGNQSQIVSPQSPIPHTGGKAESFARISQGSTVMYGAKPVRETTKDRSFSAAGKSVVSTIAEKVGPIVSNAPTRGKRRSIRSQTSTLSPQSTVPFFNPLRNSHEIGPEQEVLQSFKAPLLPPPFPQPMEKRGVNDDNDTHQSSAMDKRGGRHLPRTSSASSASSLSRKSYIPTMMLRPARNGLGVSQDADQRNKLGTASTSIPRNLKPKVPTSSLPRGRTASDSLPEQSMVENKPRVPPRAVSSLKKMERDLPKRSVPDRPRPTTASKTPKVPATKSRRINPPRVLPTVKAGSTRARVRVEVDKKAGHIPRVVGGGAKAPQRTPAPSSKTRTSLNADRRVGNTQSEVTFLKKPMGNNSIRPAVVASKKPIQKAIGVQGNVGTNKRSLKAKSLLQGGKEEPIDKRVTWYPEEVTAKDIKPLPEVSTGPPTSGSLRIEEKHIIPDVGEVTRTTSFSSAGHEADDENDLPPGCFDDGDDDVSEQNEDDLPPVGKSQLVPSFHVSQPISQPSDSHMLANHKECGDEAESASTPDENEKPGETSRDVESSPKAIDNSGIGVPSLRLRRAKSSTYPQTESNLLPERKEIPLQRRSSDNISIRPERSRVFQRYRMVSDWFDSDLDENDLCTSVRPSEDDLFQLSGIKPVPWAARDVHYFNSSISPRQMTQDSPQYGKSTFPAMTSPSLPPLLCPCSSLLSNCPCFGGLMGQTTSAIQLPTSPMTPSSSIDSSLTAATGIADSVDFGWLGSHIPCIAGDAQVRRRMMRLLLIQRELRERMDIAEKSSSNEGDQYVSSKKYIQVSGVCRKSDTQRQSNKSIQNLGDQGRLYSKEKSPQTHPIPC